MTATAATLLEVDDLHTHFHLKNKLVRAVNGVGLTSRAAISPAITAGG